MTKNLCGIVSPISTIQTDSATESLEVEGLYQMSPKLLGICAFFEYL